MKIATLVLAVGFWGAACHPSPGARPDNRVVARVGSQVIDAQALEKRFRREHLMVEDTGVPPRDYEPTHRRAVLENMVNQHLLLQEAERAHTSVNHDDVENLLTRIRAGYTDAQFMETLQKHDMTLTEFKAELREDILVRRYLQSAVYARVAVVDEDIDAVLHEHPEMMHGAERIHVRHIVVKTKEEAEQVRRMITGGVSFADAATQYSIAPDSKYGGDLGFLERGSLPKAFDDVCFALKPGTMSDIVASPSGFYLFHVVTKEEAAERDVAQVRSMIEQKLRRDKERTAEQEKIKQLRAAAHVVIEEDQIEKNS